MKCCSTLTNIDFKSTNLRRRTHLNFMGTQSLLPGALIGEPIKTFYDFFKQVFLFHLLVFHT